MSPTLTPAAAPALAPALVQNDLLETGFDALGALSSPAPPVPAVVAVVPIVPAPAAAVEPPSTTSAPSGGFDASSKWLLCCFILVIDVIVLWVKRILWNILLIFAQVLLDVH